MVDLGGGKKASHGRATPCEFVDIVGQAELKRALLTVGANTDLNGLLIQGEKGTAKSTAVRALTDLLPRQTVVEGCPYGCPPDEPSRQCDECRARTAPPTTTRAVPLVTLPLGATRERLAGTLSVADALAGEYEFDPGLLARANRGVLYVDEVNLLDDHLVDVLLDAAASGVNTVERDGVSVSHPADFTLIGTMNPEEGDLRPQLRDRFALQATVTGCADIDERVRIIDQAIGREADRVGASDTTRPETDAYRDQLRAAHGSVGDVELPTALAREIAELCRDAGVDGHRGDIATARAAMTFAALDGRASVTEADVREAATLALPHRLRSRPFEDAPDADELIDDHFEDGTDEERRDDGDEAGDRGDGGEGADGAEADGAGADGAGADEDASGSHGDTADDGHGENGGEPGGRTDERDGESHEDSTDTGGTDGERGSAPRSAEADGDPETEPAESEPAPSADGGHGGGGDADAQGEPPDETEDGAERAPVVPGQSRAGVGPGASPELSVPDAVDDGRAGGGSRARSRPHVDNDGARVRSRRATTATRVDAAASVRAAAARGSAAVESRDLRESVRQGDASSLVLFVVDASASMLPAMRTAKGTVLELLKDAYQQRDEVAFVTFAGETAEVVLPPTKSVTLAARHLKQLPTGDRTPLPAGLRTACEVLDRADPAASVVVLVTDGRANVAAESPVRETRDAARRLRELGTHVVVVDAGEGDRAAMTELIAEETGGERVPIGALSAERVESAVGVAHENQG
ncbi:VWA domain-containing protein [Natronomonas sp. EA1]|uniref:VWA domain-containing protein n=1 Tax=Natronomonas sp. EA1 TaxID=3421655 RepID=UPI003EBA6B2A